MKIEECQVGQTVRLKSSGNIYPISVIRGGRIGIDRTIAFDSTNFMWVKPESVTLVPPIVSRSAKSDPKCCGCSVGRHSRLRSSLDLSKALPPALYYYCVDHPERGGHLHPADQRKGREGEIADFEAVDGFTTYMINGKEVTEKKYRLVKAGEWNKKAKVEYEVGQRVKKLDSGEAYTISEITSDEKWLRLRSGKESLWVPLVAVEPYPKKELSIRGKKVTLGPRGEVQTVEFSLQGNPVTKEEFLAAVADELASEGPRVGYRKLKK